MTGLLLEFYRDAPNEETLRVGKPTSFVTCGPEGEKLPWKQAVPGQTVTIRGTSRTDSGRDLVHCQIEKADGPRCPELTDEQILKQFETDSAAAEKTLINGYYKNYCILRGKISSMDLKDPQSIRAKLKCSETCTIEVWFEPPDPQSVEDGKTLKEGDQITVLGTADFPRGAFHLHTGRLLKDD